jgi:spermidine synthase
MKTTLFASRTAVNSRPSIPGWTTAACLLCFFLSGFASLIYQTAWTRQFALVFGTTEVAVTTVLAAYMAGLGIGAWLVQRSLPYIERPVLVYAWIELTLGASAVAIVPALIAASDWTLRALFGHQASPLGGVHFTSLSALQVCGAFAALAAPTICMGATLPLITQHVVTNDRQVGGRVGAFYAVNTSGAVVGALVGTLWLLPAIGLSRTIWFAAMTNVIVFLVALAVVPASGRRRTGFSAAWAAASRTAVSPPPSPFWILPLMFVSGGLALYQEVLWTRLLTHVLGSSLYAFGIMVASFLTGISLGAALGATLARDRRNAVPLFVFAQLASALAAAAAYWVLESSFTAAPTAATTPLMATVLVPVALFGGASFPLAVRILARRTEDAAPATARVYAWNTFGAIAGALLGGFFLIPWLRYEGAVRLAVEASALLAIASIWLLQRPSRGLAVSVSVIGLAIMALFRPGLPTHLLMTSPLRISNEGRLVYYDTGRSATVVVLAQDGSLAYRTNGLPEALVEMRGSPPRVSGEKWLIPLAILARPSAESLLVVGYGGGVILEDVPASVKRIDVMEIEPKVIDANVAVRGLRERDPLADPRIHVVFNDARAALNLSERRYDAIISQPSHPWTAAASHLYTREFMRQAREHLNENGVFALWMNLSFVDEPLLRSLTDTLLDVFSEVRVYRPDPFTLVFLGASQRLDPEKAMESAVTAAGTSPPPSQFARLGINTSEDLLAALAADTTGLREIARGAPPVTDDHNRLATSTVYRPGKSPAGKVIAPAAVDRLFAPFDVLRTLGGTQTEHAVTGPGLSLDYIARKLAVTASIDPGAHNRLTVLADAIAPSSEAGYEVNAIRLTVDGDRDAAGDLIQEGLARYPESGTLRYEHIKPWLTRLARGTATREIVTQAAKLTGSAGAVVQGTALAADHRWSELAASDAMLASAAWTDAWKFDSIDLRVQWRLHLEGTTDLRRRYGDEAIGIIDAAVVVEPQTMLYALRVQSALAAHRPAAIAESVWEYGHGLFTNSQSQDPGVREEARSTLQALVRLLNTQNDLDSATEAERARLEEVRVRLQEDARHLST